MSPSFCTHSPMALSSCLKSCDACDAKASKAAMCKLPKCPTMEETRKAIAGLGQKKCNEKVIASVFGGGSLSRKAQTAGDGIKECASHLLQEVNDREFTALSVRSKKISQWSCEELHLGSESGFVCIKEDKTNAKKPKQTICKGLIASTKTTACRMPFIESRLVKRAKRQSGNHLSWKNSYTTQTKLMSRPLTKQIVCNGERASKCRVRKVLACRGPKCPGCSKRCVSTLKHF